MPLLEALFLLILGPPGVGKTAICRALVSRDSNFRYISPYTTRPLRPGETDKLHVSGPELDQLERSGGLLFVNELFGNRYGTPRGPIESALSSGLFPLLDWPISRVGDMMAAFPGRLFRVYVEPPDIKSLEDRLRGRPDAAVRLSRAQGELTELHRHAYDSCIDFRVVNETDKLDAVASLIYSAFVAALSRGGISCVRA